MGIHSWFKYTREGTQAVELHKRRMETAKRAADDHAVRPRQPPGRSRRAPVLPRARPRQRAALPMGAGGRGARELRADARWPRRATRVPAARRADRLPVRAAHGQTAAKLVTPGDKSRPDGGSFFTEGAGGFEPPGLGHTSHVTSIRSLGAAPA